MKATLTLLAIMAVTNLFSQNKIDFSISLGLAHHFDSNPQIIEIDTLGFFVPLNDSMSISTISASRITRRKHNQGLTPLELQARIKFKISEKITIRSGLGAHHFRFNSKTTNLDIQPITELSRDTVERIDLPDPIDPTENCNCIEDDFEDVDFTWTTYNITKVFVPLMIEHTINNKFALNYGGTIQANLKTKSGIAHKELRISDGNNPPGIECDCTYGLRTELNEDLETINQYQFSFNFGLSYNVHDVFSMELDLYKNVTNVFKQPDSIFNNESYKPMVLRFGLEYPF